MGFKLENISTESSKNFSSSKEERTSLLKKEITLFGNSFSNKIKEDFYAELGVLLKAGVSLKEALSLLANSQKKKQNQQLLKNIVEKIVQGNSFSKALEEEKPFTEYEYYSLKIGEETGTLSKVIIQLSEFFARKNEQRRNVISALTYPVIIFSTASLVVIFMLQFVVPMFQDIFKQQRVELPIITQVVIKVSSMFNEYIYLFIIITILLFVLAVLLKNKTWYKKAQDFTLLRIPYWGNFVKTAYLSQFTQAVSLLMASKVPMVHSIRLVKQMILFYPLQVALEEVEKDILKGYNLSKSLKKHKIFNEKMLALVKVAEETNQNQFIFERLNQQYNTELQQKSKMLSAVMEPFIILFVGIMVGLILIAMYLPMFKLSSVLG